MAAGGAERRPRKERKPDMTTQARNSPDAGGLPDEAERGGEGRAPLVYPFRGPPETARTFEVAPGVLWMRMPMPFALNHINVWALEDDGGYAIVDTGMRTPDTVEAWRKLFAEGLGGRPVTRVFVTHMHPDHVGLAGWITRRFGCRLWMSRLEYFSARMLLTDTGREAPQDGVDFYRRAGWDEQALETYRARFGNFGKSIYPMPDSYRRLREGEEIHIGRHAWRIVVGSGHSPEHACLYCPALRLMISGDQVLPRISPNVSVFPTEPDGDPLGDWLASLQKIENEVPADTLVLPAHNDCFHGLHTRLRHLRSGHEKGLDRLLKSLHEPRRAVDVFGSLFARKISDADLMSMATGESMAHLNYLVRRGAARVEPDAAGVNWYRAA
jgi:glyoxylase-like metal-dependent hydrolase (beta-lactamase superfamily II)